MGTRWKVLLSGALGAMLMVAPAFGQWAEGPSYSSGYDDSSFLRAPTGNPDGTQQPPVYYPNNYLDNLQQQGGYYAVTGNYPNSVPVTSYYPATSGEAPGGQPQSGMYYNPGDYYATQGQTGYQQQPQTYQQPQQGYQQPYQQTYQQPQAPSVTTESVAGKKSSKKRRVSAQQGASQSAASQPYYQQQSADPQSAYQQQQAYGQQQQAYGQQQQAYGRQQGYYDQQQAYGQQQQAYGQQQQAYGQQQQTQDGSQAGLSSDPTVQEAQKKAYERAVARQRAAELAAQQSAAAQELQQTQQMYMAAQQKLREQEERQRALQAEYQKKAVAEAYDGLRAAQERYYQLMGVSGESGGGVPQQPQQARAGQQPVPQQYPQPAQASQQMPQQYPQPAPVQAYNQGAPRQGGVAYPVSPTTVQGGGSPYSAAPPGQVTPLQVQEQAQQESGGGIWGTLKEIFAPSNVAQPTQRPSGVGNRGREGF